MKLEKLKNEELFKSPYKIKAKGYGYISPTDVTYQKSAKEGIMYILESHGETYILEINNENKEYELQKFTDEDDLWGIMGSDKYDGFLMIDKELKLDIFDILNNNLFHQEYAKVFNFTTLSYFKTDELIIVPSEDIFNEKNFIYEPSQFISGICHPELIEDILNKKVKNSSLEER